jgi:hypothetical protein
MNLCEGGAVRAIGGGGIGRVRDRWPEPMLARVVAAQEVTLGLLRRLIPRPGQVGLLPGALGARRKLSPIGGPDVFARRVAFGSECCGVEDVEGAVADLACDGQSRAAAAATLDGAFVEHVVGTCAAVRVLRRLDERPPQMA